MVSVGLASTTYKKSWMRSEVLIHHVRHWDKQDDQGMGNYSFNESEFAGNTVKIIFCGALVLSAVVDKLEDRSCFKGRARIQRYIGQARARVVVPTDIRKCEKPDMCSVCAYALTSGNELDSISSAQSGNVSHPA